MSETIQHDLLSDSTPTPPEANEPRETEVDGAQRLLSPSIRELGRRQALLRREYGRDPTVGKCISQAVSRAEPPADPLNRIVTFGTRTTSAVSYAAHEAMGGPHDAPVPLEFLCAALSSCQHMTMGVAAAVLRIKLAALEVPVDAESDLRGILGIADVPADLVSLRCTVRLRAAEGTTPAQIERLIARTEQMCIVHRACEGRLPSTTEWKDLIDRFV
jgi:uncharacterized OsmC-like protein